MFNEKRLDNWLIWGDPRGATKSQIEKWWNENKLSPREAAIMLIKGRKYTHNEVVTDFNN